MKEVKLIVKQFKNAVWINDHELTIKTVLGNLYIRFDLRLKSNMAFMRFTDGLNEDQLKEYRNLIGSTAGLNLHSFKWNLYEPDRGIFLALINNRLKNVL